MSNDNKLALEIAAEVELTLDERADQIAKRIYESWKLINLLREKGLVKKIETEAREYNIAGICSGKSTLSAFHGILYGICSVSIQMNLIDKEIGKQIHHSKVITGDIDFFGSGDRFLWKQYINTLDLIDEILGQSKDKWPEMIIIDIPLLITREKMLLGLDTSPEVKDEWEKLLKRVRSFWDVASGLLYPFNKGGPVLISLIPKVNGGILMALSEKGKNATADDIDNMLKQTINNNIKKIKTYGSARIMNALLTPKMRSLSYSLHALSLDSRTEPEELFKRGVLSFFMKPTLKSSNWEIQLIGNTNDWSSAMLDRVAGMIMGSVLIDHNDTLPVPLWFARKKSIFPKKVIEYMKRQVAAKLGSVEKEEY